MQNSSKNQKSEFLRLSLTLFVIAGVMALLVALVNNITAPEITRRNELKTTEALKAVMPDADTFEDAALDITSVTSADGKDVPINGAWFAQKDGETVGVCVRVSPQGYGGAIETIVGVDKDGNVTDTEIVSISETSGIGTKIQDESFLTQFIGKKNNITASEGTNSVTLISGATKSSKAYLRGINAALSVASTLQGGEDNE